MSDTSVTASSDDSSIDSYLASRGLGTTGMAAMAPDKGAASAASPAMPSGDLLRMPAFPSMPKLRDVPKAPQDQFENPMRQFGGPAMFLASLGSLMTRHPMKTALNSASEMIQADVKGQKEQMELHRENWRNSTEAALAQNRIEIERYKAIMNKYQHDTEAQAAYMMGMASGFNDPQMRAMISTGQIQNVWSLIQDREKRGKEAADFMLRQKEQDEREKHNRITEEETKRRNDAITGLGASEGNIDVEAQKIVELKRAPPPVNSRRPGDLRLWAKVHEIDPDYDASHWTKKNAEASAGGRVRGGREEALSMILDITKADIPAALAASAKVPRGSVVPLNKWINQGRVMVSDPDQAEFAFQNLNLAEHWAKSMNPGGVMRVDDRDKALEILHTAWSNGTYERLARAIEAQIGRELNAIRSGGKPGLSQIGSDGAEGAPKEGERKQFKQGWGVYRNGKWEPEQ